VRLPKKQRPETVVDNHICVELSDDDEEDAEDAEDEDGNLAHSEMCESEDD
jgi:hypothetical protein